MHVEVSMLKWVVACDVVSGMYMCSVCLWMVGNLRGRECVFCLVVVALLAVRIGAVFRMVYVCMLFLDSHHTLLSTTH